MEIYSNEKNRYLFETNAKININIFNEKKYRAIHAKNPSFQQWLIQKK